MKSEIKYVIGMIVLGASLVAYAHANFASKNTVEIMDARIYEIWKQIVVKK